MKTSERVTLAPAYMLHQLAWRESSRIVEIFSLEHGRLGLVARGSRRHTSPVRALLTPFRPLLLSWTHRGELGTLTQVEVDGPAHGLSGRSLLGGFYLNELLLALIARHDAQPELYGYYANALSTISEPERLESGLRIFELQLLEAMGYGLNLSQESTHGEPVDAAHRYRFEAERGMVRVESPGSGGVIVKGATLLALQKRDLTEATSLREARMLLRAAIDYQLGGRRLKSRDVLKGLMRYEGGGRNARN